MARRWPTRIRRRRSSSRSAPEAESERRRRAARARADRRSTRTRRPTSKAAIERVLDVQPEAPRGAVDEGGDGLRRGPRPRNTRPPVAEALKIHPTYGEIHRIVGSITAHYYRFDEAVEHTRKAIALDRENIRAVADLGAQLMRTGDERNARRNLETAFRIDHWDVHDLQPARAARQPRAVRHHQGRRHGDPAGAGRIAGDEGTTCRSWRASRSTRSASGGSSRRRGRS